MRRGTVSWNSRFQTARIQQYSANLSIHHESSGVSQAGRELEDRVPRLHSPENSRRMFGDVCKNKPIFLLVFVENGFLTFPPVDLLGKPYPVFK